MSVDVTSFLVVVKYEVYMFVKTSSQWHALLPKSQRLDKTMLCWV